MIAFLTFLLWLLRFALGAAVFSFLGVVACRLPRGEDIVRGRSHCDSCGRTLSARELVPVISYLAQRGRCRSCGAKIPARCLLGELIGGFAYCLAALRYGSGDLYTASLSSLIAFAYIAILYVVAVIDLDTQEIYDRFHVMILVLAVLSAIEDPSLADRAVGAVAISLPMLILALIIPGAFGGGDIKLMAASGALLGTRAIVCAMFFGLISGGVYALYMLVTKKLQKGDKFAFGPYLAFGLALAALYGNEIAGWYLSFF